MLSTGNTMSGIFSSLQQRVSAVIEGFKILTSLNASYNALVKRISSTPPLPVANSTSSYWFDDPPHPHLDTLTDIPPETDVLIIGSGISGVSAAKSILELSDQKVLVVDARGVCSGATGRNGGHIKATPHGDFADQKRSLSETDAKRIVEFQLRHLEALLEVGAEIPEAEAREVETMDVYITEEEFSAARKAVEEFNAAKKSGEEFKRMMDVDIQIWQDEKDLKRLGVPTAVGAITYKAGAMWPYRLVTGVWNQLLDKYSNLTLATQTPVTDVRTTDAGLYQVETPRGTIRAKQILYATNGYTGRLLPELRQRLTSVKGHMTAQTPSPASSLPPSGKSWTVVYPGGFDYITQRENGDVMLGGGFARSKDNGLDHVGVWDDSTKDTLTLMHVSGVMPALFDVAVDVKRSWTGIMGYTGDLRPYVGKLKGNEWVSVGFCGHGMVWAWLCGVAVGVMMVGREDEKLDKSVGRPGGKLDDWFPRDLLAVRKGNVLDLKDVLG